MANTAEGAKKAAITNKARYGKDFHQRIGAMGAAARTKPAGFASLVIGADGLTGLERARRLGHMYGRRNGHWTAKHRANFEKAIEKRKGIGWEVDLSNIDLELDAIIWYKAIE